MRMMLRIKWLPHLGTLLRNSGWSSGFCSNFAFSSFSVSGFRLILMNFLCGGRVAPARPGGVKEMFDTRTAPERLGDGGSHSRCGVFPIRGASPKPPTGRPQPAPLPPTYKESFIFALADGGG